MSNQLPIRARREAGAWEFEWDEDALVAQAKAGVPDEYDVVYVGGLSVDVDVMEQEEVAAALKAQHNCAPVFLAPELKEKYYKGARVFACLLLLFLLCVCVCLRVCLRVCKRAAGRSSGVVGGASRSRLSFGSTRCTPPPPFAHPSTRTHTPHRRLPPAPPKKKNDSRLLQAAALAALPLPAANVAGQHGAL